MRLFRSRNLLDEEECWKLWIAPEGSLPKTIKRFNAEGKLNPRTGRPFSPSGIEKAALRWAIKNPVEARRDLETKLYSWGETITDDDWHQYLYDAVKTAHKTEPRKIERLVNRLGLQKYANS